MQTKHALTPEQQAERERLKQEIDRLNRQISQVVAKIATDIQVLLERQETGHA